MTKPDMAPSMPTNGASYNVVLDIWGGEYSQTHVARMMLPPPLALKQAEIELASGYLVKMRSKCGWGEEEDFDLRAPSGAN